LQCDSNFHIIHHAVLLLFVLAAAMQQTFTEEQREEIYHSLMPHVLNPSAPLLITQLGDASADL
jgi:hypothetical protein